ncbi:MAG: type I-E CRISPR-associated endoribonuclease Cas2e [Nostocoides sp.]
MVIVVLSLVPPGLRGIVTRWLLEIAPGVFVGRVSARVRERLWDRILHHVGDGNALIVWRSNSEQGMEFRRHNYPWDAVDFDDLLLVGRPTPPEKAKEIARRLALE